MTPEQKFAKINDLEKQIKEELIRVEEKIKVAESRKKTLSKELEQFGIKPENQTIEFLDREISARRKKLDVLLAEQEEILIKLQTQLNSLSFTGAQQ